MMYPADGLLPVFFCRVDGIIQFFYRINVLCGCFPNHRIYPVRKTAEMALARDDLFVLEDDGKICGTGILNKIQVDSYAEGHWEHEVPDEQVCVLHTLVIDPNSAGKGYGRAFIEYYETYAQENGCTELRIDTNARNAVARAMYKKHGYTEIGIVPTVFNSIEGVQLVLLEKYLGK